MISAVAYEPLGEQQRNPPIDPPLKWAGGKRWLVPNLRDLYAPFRPRRLVEPFSGGLAVSLGLRPERALIGDINEHLVSFFLWLRRGFVVEFPLVNDADRYYAYRTQFNQLVREGSAACSTAAGLFYYLNRTCYNGLCRFNGAGEFNVPFGSYKKINYQSDFRSYAGVLEGWTIMRTDFEALPVEQDDFIYADPPYDVNFTKYSKEDFSWADQVRLAHWLSKHPGPVVASNQATERVLELYRGFGFVVEEVLAPRMISCNGNRSKVAEMLAFRNLG